MKTVKINNQYTVKINQRETGSNYGMFVGLYKNNEKLPTVGSCLKNGSTKEQVIEWANKSIEAKTTI